MEILSLNLELFKPEVNKDLVAMAIIKTTTIREYKTRFVLRLNKTIELMRMESTRSIQGPDIRALQHES
jgi:hypothetical protein